MNVPPVFASIEFYFRVTFWQIPSLAKTKKGYKKDHEYVKKEKGN